MKRLTIILLAAAAMVCAASCGNNGKKAEVKGPEKAAKEALNAVQKGDFDAYAATFNLPESDQKMLAGMAQEKVAKEIEKKGGMKGYKINNTTIEEDKATVDVTIEYKDGSEETSQMHFTKVNDDWKQELDK